MRLDDRNALRDAPSVSGVLFELCGDALAREGAELGSGGRLVAAGVADGVEEAKAALSESQTLAAATTTMM